MALCKFPSSIRAALLIAAALVIATAMRPALAQEGVEIAVESFQSDAEGRLAADVVVTLPPIAGRATVLGTLESEPPASGVYRVEFLADGATEPVEYEVTASQFGLTEAQLPIFLANVVAIGAGGGGSPEPPDAPANLVATAGDAEVELAWDAVTGADTYNVYRSLTSGSGFTLLVDELATPEYTDATAENGTEYFYYVTAINAGGESDPSNEDSATPSTSSLAPDEVPDLEIWLDPGDAGTVSLSGALITAVADQSGEGRNFPAYAEGFEPTYTDGGIDFTQQLSALALASSYNIGNRYTIFVVAKHSDVEANINTFYNLSVSVNQTAFGQQAGPIYLLFHEYSDTGAGGSVSWTDNALAPLVDQVGLYVIERSADDLISAWCNATALGAGSQSGSQTEAFIIDAIGVENNIVKEIAVYSRALTSGERDGVTAFLMAKHSITP